MEGFVTPPEAAKRLGVSVRTVQRWLKARKVPARRMPSGHWWIPESWVEEQKQGTEAGKGAE